jgi:protoheme IX farnesyltransferase
VYTIAALLGGGWFVYESHRLYSLAKRGTETVETTNKSAMRVFHGSISYLTVLFLALAVDPFVGGPVFAAL